ncbi:MAG: phosphoribosylamine--glycine ligase [Apilactobacillus sp.]|uniref:phosphoribosylamine--glycine ligase n=1 Tax=Apilactobacillus sp. TaxID=2767901 RepID=UPI0025EC16CA|nr:phosphoribosylamine--glycine ligase [Apilactobacillus sp.]MCT6822959.1 phosphoribosylamine--glycine ligase [Apilactobacillus sp.]MCT6857987.1 phosphoribosylamine--glycine ligase [Apilactobacillus sp.]
MENWLLIGSGGREYAMAKQLTKSANRHVYVAPGNPMMNILKNVETLDIEECDFEALIEFAKQNQIDWTLVGPEKPLSEGVVDCFKDAGLNIFGPNQAAAQLESSKEFAKDVMTSAGVATAQYATFDNQNQALKYLETTSFPVVIKLNGLASGKGVFIAATKSDAENIINDVYQNNANQEILMEDYLVGQEFSMIVMVNDLDVVTMPLAQDHKRIYDGDKGLNTGGMGAYSPLPQFGSDVVEDGLVKVIRPVLEEMHRRDILFQGFLYAGLIMTDDGIKVIEFNVRMGDPETQVILPQLQDDFGEIIKQLMNHQQPTVNWSSNRYYLGSVLAAKGYPQQHLDAITLPEFTQPDIEIDYAGVKEQDEKLVSSGGRIMMVISSDGDLKKAQTRVNQVIKDTVDANLYSFRTDIGNKAFK